MKSLVLSRKIRLPGWVKKVVDESASETFATKESRMAFVLELCRMNILRKTGGPFAAAIFHLDDHRLVAVGVNRVVQEHCSLGHGEIMALLMAQERLKTHDLASGPHPLELVTSAQPCIQCYGALIWSGIRHVTIGALKEDVERLTGFDEGPSPADWKGEWAKRGIGADVGVLRDEACQLLEQYRRTGGVVYNATSNPLG